MERITSVGKMAYWQREAGGEDYVCWQDGILAKGSWWRGLRLLARWHIGKGKLVERITSVGKMAYWQREAGGEDYVCWQDGIFTQTYLHVMLCCFSMTNL